MDKYLMKEEREKMRNLCMVSSTEDFLAKQKSKVHWFNKGD